ncbi:restriction endonuclease [Microbacterium sp. M3]|uniref:Restriction endonuclease n=1 Tax=Microbacterium arthrosphaerae TaxID=792652 RepID=A0ABU4GZZ8_9MICO|nr:MULTISPECIES: restriction endonuclease [Microbacterium]MDW4572595.1 restriction endonuclease [Microbacterium arthrosphaerae]MDW7606450.1 restriction endonuclease [Microbacterium sp. M3]
MSFKVTERDGMWAWRLGLQFGAWHPTPDRDLGALGREWIRYANPHLNQVTDIAGRRYFGVGRESPGESQLTDEQLRKLFRPFLQELAETSTYAFEAAIYYRRSMRQLTGYDPRIADANERKVSDFARDVDGFLGRNPDLQFFLRSVLATDGSQARVMPAPAPPRPEPPAPQPYGVSHVGAEYLVAAWMRHLGALDAKPTKVSGDGGIDVVSARYIAQVKNLGPAAAVPIAHIRDLAGVASVDTRKAAMFTSGVYSSGGSEFADRAGIALFRYDAVRGWLGAVNEHARRARAEGMR